MTRHFLTVACIGTVMGATVGWTQNPPPRAEGSGGNPLFDLRQDEPLQDGSFIGFPQDGDDALRERLLRLVEEKARLMNAEELEESLAEVQGDISELQALQKMEQVRKLLSAIVEQHVTTQGAREARRMLDTASDSEAVTSFGFVASPVDGPASPRTGLSESELREEVLRLSEEQAQLMDRDSLEQAITDVRDDITELQAIRKLEEARQILSSIIEDQEGTDGAVRAQRMLDVDKAPLPSESSPFFQGNPI